jgi:hypothetical protein
MSGDFRREGERTKAKIGDLEAQAVEYLPIKYKALSSNPSILQN